MRLLLVAAGASIALKDVENGYRKALKRAGVEVVDYALDLRINKSASWLEYLWRTSKKAFERPTHADVLYHAGNDVLTLALRNEVDFVLVVSGMFLHPDNFMLLRRGNIPHGVMLTESPYDDEHQRRYTPWPDVCWTNERSSVQYLRQTGTYLDKGIARPYGNPNTHYLAHAFDAEVHHPFYEDPEPLHDVVFVGTGFPDRIELLEKVNFEGIDFGLYGSWSLLGSRSKLRKHLRKDNISNAEAVALYRRSKIGLNMHRRAMGYGRMVPMIEHAESLNPRAYELAACGIFQISDWRQELDEVFGGAVPVFHDPAQISRMLRLYLNDDKAREQSAQRAMEAIQNETFDERVKQVIEDIEAVISPRKLVAMSG